MVANVWTPEFQEQVIWTGVTAFATGIAVGAALTIASPAIVTAAVIVGAAMLMKSAIDVGAKGYQAYTGTDMLGRPLCPNQIEQLEREMILEGVGFAAGMLGGGLGGGMAGGAGKGGLYKGLTENSGRAGNKGSGVYIGEATSGNFPRNGLTTGLGEGATNSAGLPRSGGAARNPVYDRLESAVNRNGGTLTSDGASFQGRPTAARQAASEVAGDLGSKPIVIRKSDYNGAPKAWEQSSQVIGKMSADRSSGWRDDMIGHARFGAGPHVNAWSSGINFHFWY